MSIEGFPVVTWLPFAGASLVFAVFYFFLNSRLKPLRATLAIANRGNRESGSFALDSIFSDSSNRRRYVQIQMVLTDARVLTWLGGAIAIASWLFTWLVFIRYGYLLYVTFAIFVFFLVFNRPLDAIESCLIAARYRNSRSSRLNKIDSYLLTQVYERISRARWFYLGFGAWFALFATGDYLLGQSLSEWLHFNTGSWGSYLAPSNWQFVLFLAALAASGAVSVLVWPRKELSMEPSESNRALGER